MVRYEINHDGIIVPHESALCSDLDKMLTSLFNQYGRTSEIAEKAGAYRKIKLKDPNGNIGYINVYCGTIRNEARNPYEKKIQLGTARDPRNDPKNDTVILGVYVFEKDDGISDAVFVGYPIDDSVRYDTNPSIRGISVDKLLIDAKNSGFIYDREHNTVGFLVPFIYYYLDNHYALHYASDKFPEVSYDDEPEISPEEYPPDESELRYETNCGDKGFARNRIIFGAPGTGKSYMLNSEREILLGAGKETDYERVTFHPDYSYANFVGTYKPVTVGGSAVPPADPETEKVLSVLNDGGKTAQEKYDLFYNDFKDEGLTRLPVILGLYSDEPFKTRKQDGSYTADNNGVEKNHGRSIRKYVNLITGKDKPGEIAYEYVPGPFMRVYVNALKSARSESPRPYLLIIEEINRANVAAVFGDIFQLLDRGDSGVSEYPVQASEDIKKYLARELGGSPDDYTKLRLPDNMFIWATMNSADQGVFPMDTAFKRRWDFTYLGIDDNDEDIRGKFVRVGKNKKQRIEWNSLRKAINDFLADEKINEDKQLGPYFISRSIVVPADGGAEIDSEKFCRVFKNKVLMYLFEDAAKQKRQKLFEGCAKGQTRYSKICEAFDEQGIDIFNRAIREAVVVSEIDEQADGS